MPHAPTFQTFALNHAPSLGSRIAETALMLQVLGGMGRGWGWSSLPRMTHRPSRSSGDQARHSFRWPMGVPYRVISKSPLHFPCSTGRVAPSVCYRLVIATYPLLLRLRRSRCAQYSCSAGLSRWSIREHCRTALVNGTVAHLCRQTTGPKISGQGTRSVRARGICTYTHRAYQEK
jgi:hypothetical protein